MSNRATIVKVLDFVEENLCSEIGVADMAEAASYSLYHFCRVFNQVTHHTPYDYLMRRRLSESARDLVESDRRIVDIAFEYRFNSHETFSRAFKRMFGMQPNRWRQRGLLDRRALMPRLTAGHIHHLHKGEYLRPVWVEWNTVNIWGLMTQVRGDIATIPQLWQCLDRELLRLEISLDSHDSYGLAWYSDGWDGQGYHYFAGARVELDYDCASPLVCKKLPALRYARFVHMGNSNELGLTLDYVYHTWCQRSGHRPLGDLVMEHSPQWFGMLDDPHARRELYFPIEYSDK